MYSLIDRWGMLYLRRIFISTIFKLHLLSIMLPLLVCVSPLGEKIYVADMEVRKGRRKVTECRELEILRSVDIRRCSCMDREMLNYYRLTIFFLSMLGLWPYQRERLRLLQNVVVSFIITLSTFVQLTPFASGKATKQDILKNVSSIFMTSGVLAKYFLFLRETEVIRELLEGINRDWKTADDEELKIIKEHACLGKRYSMIFAGEGYTRDETLKIYMLTRLRKTPVAVFIYLSTFGAMALHFSSTLLDIVLPLNETRLYKSPIVTEYFIDEQKYYFRIAVYQGLMILIGGTVYVATESLTFMWMMHSACLYRLVR
ncbi:uncharacterized protein LOC143371407 isoform X1 [Andrena cerasifolii]|uniref:uncharacterized protein LOC143371407 isoform X1 n=1 Tax=Andrena cerasifolii TaxID=2819439 RepID=UPI004037B1F3